MRRPKRTKVITLSPGFDGKRELAVVDVADPLKAGAKTQVARNTACTGLHKMHSLGRISDAEMAAGQRFQHLHERVAIGSYGSFDYSQERVDMSGKGDPMTEAVASAGKELAKVSREVGPVGYNLLISIAAEGATIAALAQQWSEGDGDGASRDRAFGYISGRIIEALRALVVFWGMEARGKERATIRVGLAEYAPRRLDRRYVPVEPLRPVAGQNELIVNQNGDLVAMERKA